MNVTTSFSHYSNWISSVVSITVQLQGTVLRECWFFDFFWAGKSKETREFTALRDIELTMICRERWFWNKAEFGDCTLNLWNGGGIKMNQETSMEKKRIKWTDNTLTEAGHYTCQTECQCDHHSLSYILTKYYFWLLCECPLYFEPLCVNITLDQPVSRTRALGASYQGTWCYVCSFVWNY